MTTNAYPSAVLADAPALYWRFEETAGTLAADSSGHGQDGTYLDGPALGVAGLIDAAGDLAFDNLAGSGYATHDGNVVWSGAAYSVECWLRLAANQQDGRTFWCIHATTDSNPLVECWFPNGQPGHVQVYVRNSNGDSETADPAITIDDDTRHHLVWTWSAGAWTVWLDGVEAGSGAMTVSGTIGGTQATCGADTHSGGASKVATATFDEFALYPVALSGARVLAHYLAGVRWQPSAARTEPATLSATPQPATLALLSGSPASLTTTDGGSR